MNVFYHPILERTDVRVVTRDGLLSWDWRGVKYYSWDVMNEDPLSYAKVLRQVGWMELK